MDKNTTSYEDYVTLMLYNHKHGPRPLCPFRSDFGDRWCDDMYTERCYHCYQSKDDYKLWKEEVEFEQSNDATERL